MDNGTQTGMGDPNAQPQNQQPPQGQPPQGQPQQPRATAPAARVPAGSPINSVMSGIVLGGLTGAAKAGTKVAKGIGQGFRNFAYNSPTAIEAREANTRQQQAKQSMEIQKEQEMDSHQEHLLNLNIMNQTQLRNSIQNKYLDEQLKNTTEEGRMLLQKQHEEMNTAVQDQLAQFEMMGLHSSEIPWDQFNGQLGGDMARGKVAILANGDPKNPGVHKLSPDEMASIQLPHDITVPKWGLDPKTGAPVREGFETVAAGHGNTLLTAYTHLNANMREYQMNMDNYVAKLKAAEAGASAKKNLSAAALSEAETANLRNMGVSVPENYVPNPNVLQMKAADIMTDMRSKGVQVPPDFQSMYSIGRYDSSLKSLSTTAGRQGMPNRTQDQANTFIRTFINPNFNPGNYDIVQNMKKEFADTKPTSAGGNLIAFNTATGHLGQLYQATQALKLQGNDQLKALNQIANRLGLETGSSAIPVFNAIRTALVGELGKTFKGTAADIPEREALDKSLNESYDPRVLDDVEKQYAHLMLSKSGALLDRYIGYTGELPPQAITSSAQRVYDAMGIDSSEIFQGAQVVPGRAPNMNVRPNPQDSVPPGKQPAYNKSTGAIIGYADDAQGTNFVRF